MRRVLAALLLAALPTQAHAWGATGHRIVGELGMEALPEELPAFLRTPQAVADVAELAREPDRWKGAGKLHDSDRDPAHFIDVDDAGLIMGGPPLAALPETRADYESALRAVGSDAWQAGYLYYALVDGWQQLMKDFATWRAVAAAEARTDDPARRAWYAADRARREALIVRDIGVFAHYVGDASQPLHVSVHFNGWGDYPNPHGFTVAAIHNDTEGAFVKANVGADAVRARMAPRADCPCAMETRTVRYLQATAATVQPFYALEKQGGFTGADPRGAEFAAGRLAAGAAELRDLLVHAWRASGRATFGWPPLSVADVESGAVDPYDSLYGTD